MPLVINTNVSSLNAQRQLVKSGNDMAQAMERLSSGKRINTAGDDAAGLAISNRMTSQIRGLNQAIRNASDGISLIQTAEGALDESTNILQRIRELAIQSANGIYDDANRATLDAEVQQLITEIDRISQTTSFNGQKVLDGSLDGVDLQIGSQQNETLQISITPMDAGSLGLGSLSTDLAGGHFDYSVGHPGFDEGDILINGVALSAHNFITDNLENLINDINDNVENVSASGFNVVQSDVVGSGVLGTNEVLRITLGSVDGQLPTNYDIQNSANMDELVSRINAKTGGAITASLDENSRLVLSNATGGDITIAFDGDITDNSGDFDVTAGAQLAAITGITDDGVDGTEVFRGSLSLVSDNGDEISVTKGANGTDEDLATIGFREIAGNTVQSTALSATAQNTGLNAGDLFINGLEVQPTTTADGLQGKVDNINDLTEETGVVASVRAEQSFGFNGLLAPVEVTGAAAYAAPTASFQNLTPANGYAAIGGDFTGGGLGNAVFDVVDMSGETYTVTLDQNSAGNVATLVGDINNDLPQRDILKANAVVGGTDPATFFPTDFTAPADFSFDVTHPDGVTVDNVTITTNVTSAADLITEINLDLTGTMSAYLDPEGRLTLRDTTGGANPITIDNFASGLGFVAGTADELLGMSIEDGSTEIGSLETIVEAYVDHNGAIALRDLSGGDTGNLTIDSVGLVYAGTAGDLNNALGFDIEDLAGSNASAANVFVGASEAFNINDFTIVLTDAQADGNISATEIAAAVNAAVGTTGVSAYVDDSDQLHFSSSEPFTVDDDPGSSNFVANLDPGGTLIAGTYSTAVLTGSIIINGYEVENIDLVDLDNAVATINAEQANTGVVATIDENGELQLAANSAITLEVGQTNGLAAGAAIGVNFVDVDDDNDATTLPNIPDGTMDTVTLNAGIQLRQINDGRPIQIQVTNNGELATGLMNLNTELSGIVTGSPLSSVSVATAEGAQETIGVIDVALETVNAIRSDLGAINNRLDFTISNLMNVSENTSAARSRIQDADFAAETAELSRAQVLQSASQAMLAQANARTQQVLQLLNG